MVGRCSGCWSRSPSTRDPSEFTGRTENMRYVNFAGHPRLVGQFVDVRDHRGDGELAARPSAGRRRAGRLKRRGKESARSPTPMSTAAHRDFTLLPDDAERLANLAGPFDEHLRQIELRLGVEIANRGNVFRVTGDAEAAVARPRRCCAACTPRPATRRFDPHKIHLRLNAANVASADARGRRRRLRAAGSRDPRQARHRPRPRRQPGQVPARDRHPRHQLRHRPGRHRQDLPRRRQRGRGAERIARAAPAAGAARRSRPARSSASCPAT